MKTSIHPRSNTHQKQSHFYARFHYSNVATETSLPIFQPTFLILWRIQKGVELGNEGDRGETSHHGLHSQLGHWLLDIFPFSPGYSSTGHPALSVPRICRSRPIQARLLHKNMCVQAIPGCVLTESPHPRISCMLHLCARRSTTESRPILPGFDPVMYLSLLPPSYHGRYGLLYCRLYDRQRCGVSGVGAIGISRYLIMLLWSFPVLMLDQSYG